MTTKLQSILDNIKNESPVKIADSFADAMADKINDKVAEKRLDVAQTMVGATDEGE